jgi:hypothetical protein
VNIRIDQSAVPVMLGNSLNGTAAKKVSVEGFEESKDRDFALRIL